MVAPVRLARWFEPVTGELRLGPHQVEGNATGEVAACEPPRTPWAYEPVCTANSSQEQRGSRQPGEA
ncbi:hypothetical protein [Actinocatenispora rupis]|uniref:Uncharacterized protein n=1 Tax=Actinocatenispora rupis TaxID=519421 RepID=A0A8J3J1K9_9ACTN|nr:hypothetical protein [Actinocatenispora rupis]GID14096.1 hypothetical protein Aru02nite_49850 [Actinocatenispora rupis]